MCGFGRLTCRDQARQATVCTYCNYIVLHWGGYASDVLAWCIKARSVLYAVPLEIGATITLSRRATTESIMGSNQGRFQPPTSCPRMPCCDSQPPRSTCNQATIPSIVQHAEEQQLQVLISRKRCTSSKHQYDENWEVFAKSWTHPRKQDAILLLQHTALQLQWHTLTTNVTKHS